MLCQCCQIDYPRENFPQRGDSSGRIRPYCRECAKDGQRARYARHKREAPFKLRCSRAKSRAQFLKVPFDLTPEYLANLWTGICPAFGIPIDHQTDRDAENAAELDRLIPALGYVQGNVAWLSRKANRIKNNVELSELETLVKWMHQWKQSI
jgi:hypothetical protein